MNKPFKPPLPRALPKAAALKVHQAVEAHLAAVEALTAFLDEVDGDPEQEPSLGSLTSHENWTMGGTDEREGDEHDGREDGGDEEPNLAHGNDLDQTRATKHITGAIAVKGGGGWVYPYWDLEADNSDSEPSLGSTNGGPGGTDWSETGASDREGDDEREQDDEREPELSAGTHDWCAGEPVESWDSPVSR